MHSVLPLLTNSCTAEYLHKLAIRVNHHEAFFNSPAKDEVVVRLLEASIIRMSLPSLKAQLDDAALAQSAIETLTSTTVSCAEAQCPSVLPQLIARVTDNTGLNQEEIALHVINVLSPFLSTCAEKLAVLAPRLSHDSFFGIQVAVCKLIIADLSVHFGPTRAAEEHCARLFNTVFGALDCIWKRPGGGGVDATLHAYVQLRFVYAFADIFM